MYVCVYTYTYVCMWVCLPACLSVCMCECRILEKKKIPRLMDICRSKQMARTTVLFASKTLYHRLDQTF